jgi:hypothetical protein
MNNLSLPRLALIEGDLALPTARPLRGLPPPFGVPRRPLGAHVLCWAPPMSAAAAQQAIPKAGRHERPQRRSPLPAGTKFRFFYMLPKPLEYPSQFDAQLTEARHYLEAAKARPCSSRSDHVLGAAIFAACCIALAWLLITSAPYDADNPVSVAMARSPVVHLQDEASSVQPRAQVARRVARHDPPAANPAPQGSPHSEPMLGPQPARPVKSAPLPQRGEPYKAARAAAHDTATRRTAKGTGNRMGEPAVARLNRAKMDERLALRGSIHPFAQPSASKQAERAARSPATDDAAELAALREWAAQQQRASITTRASASAGDTGWNTRRTQRRITDNPDAFVAGTVQGS